MAEIKKCAHPSCHCLAADGEEYCSTYCRDAKGMTELSCNCGHKGCALEAGAGTVPVGVE